MVSMAPGHSDRRFTLAWANAFKHLRAHCCSSNGSSAMSGPLVGADPLLAAFQLLWLQCGKECSNERHFHHRCTVHLPKLADA